MRNVIKTVAFVDRCKRLGVGLADSGTGSIGVEVLRRGM